MRIPREAPATISIAPLRASAFKCSSAALGDLKPNVLRVPALLVVWQLMVSYTLLLLYTE